VVFWSLVGSVAWDTKLDRAMRDHGRGNSVYALSCLTHSLCIAERNGLNWASSLYCLWPIQAYYGSSEWRPGGYHDWDKMSESERQFLSRVVDDLERARPGLLLVDKQPPSPELAGFDFLEYLRRVPRFSGVMLEYRYLRASDRYHIYRRDSALLDERRTVSRWP
jgi:hypothetical protein